MWQTWSELVCWLLTLCKNQMCVTSQQPNRWMSSCGPTCYSNILLLAVTVSEATRYTNGIWGFLHWLCQVLPGPAHPYRRTGLWPGAALLHSRWNGAKWQQQLSSVVNTTKGSVTLRLQPSPTPALTSQWWPGPLTPVCIVSLKNKQHSVETLQQVSTTGVTELRIKVINFWKVGFTCLLVYSFTATLMCAWLTSLFETSPAELLSWVKMCTMAAYWRH